MEECMHHEVFLQDTFTDAFIGDLDSAKGLVVIQSPFLSVKRVAQLSEAIKKCVARRVRICVLFQNASDHNVYSLSAQQTLLSLGVHLNARENIHEKLAIIDDQILWEGSLNILSFNNSLERMNRFIWRAKVKEVIKSHRLDSCTTCAISSRPSGTSKALGLDIASRRKLFGLSQQQLAERAGISRNVLSEIESGKSNDIKVATLEKIFDCLDMGLLSAPRHFLPAVHDFVNQ